MKTIVFSWPKFGPYHVARIQAVAETLENSYRCVGLETNPADSTYGWNDVQQGLVSFEWCKPIKGESLGCALSRIQPDVVFVNGWGFSDSRQVLFWAWRNRVRRVMLSDSKAGDSSRRWVSEFIKCRIVRSCHAGLVAGPEHRDYLASLGMQCDRIWDGLDVVDNDHFARGVRQPRQPLFLYVGRLVEKKNVSGLIDAYCDYRDQMIAVKQTPWGLRIVGSGPLESELLTQAVAMGLSDTIEWLPFTQYEQLPELYGSARCVVVPSTHSEQWGLVVNESLAAGTPVIVSNACGCASSLVEPDRSGLVFEPRNNGELTDRLSQMHRLSEQAWGEMSRCGQEIVSKWDLNRFAVSVGEILTAVFKATK